LSFKYLTKQFSASVGQRSRGYAGPDTLEDELDRLYASLDPTKTINFPDGTTRVGGLHVENLSESFALPDTYIGNRTVNDTETVNTNTGTLTKILSMFATMIKRIVGGANWRSAVPITLTQIDTTLNQLNTSTGQIGSLLGEVGTTLGQHVEDTENPHEVNAEQIGALVSINNVSNAGGNINLVRSAMNETLDISFTSDNLSKQIEVWADINNGKVTNAMLGADVKVGSLSDLETTVKTSVVAAINEHLNNDDTPHVFKDEALSVWYRFVVDNGEPFLEVVGVGQ